MPLKSAKCFCKWWLAPSTDRTEEGSGCFMLGLTRAVYTPSSPPPFSFQLCVGCTHYNAHFYGYICMGGLSLSGCCFSIMLFLGRIQLFSLSLSLQIYHSKDLSVINSPYLSVSLSQYMYCIYVCMYIYIYIHIIFLVMKLDFNFNYQMI